MVRILLAFGIVLVIWYGLFRILPRDQALLSFDLLLVALFWIRIVIALWRRRQAGALLSALGRPIAYRVLILLGAGIAGIVILRGIKFLTLSAANTFSSRLFLTLALVVSTYIYSLAFGWQGPQIRENGILNGTEFIRWERIESYELYENRLLLRVKRGSSISPVIWSISPVDKDKADIIAKHLSD